MDTSSFRPPLTLAGRYVKLVPLEPSHRDALFAASRDPDVFRYLRVGPMTSPAAMEALIEGLLREQASGADLPFTVTTVADGRPIGMTRFLRVERENDKVEIGGTWYERRFWRTPINTECKLLLLRHAFEVERAHRVQLQTDSRNERSQAAIARLGAVREGTLREDVLLPDGRRRSSVYFSLLATEWPAARERLVAALARPWAPGEA